MDDLRMSSVYPPRFGLKYLSTALDLVLFDLALCYSALNSLSRQCFACTRILRQISCYLPLTPLYSIACIVSETVIALITPLYVSNKFTTVLSPEQLPAVDQPDP